nr:hypothetical protein [Micrococcus sp. HMSC067E09]
MGRQQLGHGGVRDAAVDAHRDADGDQSRDDVHAGLGVRGGEEEPRDGGHGHHQADQQDDAAVAHAVREVPADGHEAGGEHAGRQDHPEDEGLRQLQHGAEVAGQVGHDQVEGRGQQGDHTHDQHDLAREAEGLAQRGLGGALLGVQALELRGVLEAHADEDRDRAQRAGDDERDAPAPVLHGLGTEGPGHAVADEGTDHQAGGGGGHQGGGREAAAALLGELGDEGGDGGDLAAGGEALDHAQEDQQDRGHDADRVGGRQQTDAHGGAAHDAEDDHEGPAAADLVRERTEEQAAERADEEGEGEDGEGREQADDRIVRDEEVGPDVHGEEAVDAVVVPLDQVAGGRPDECLAAFARADLLLLKLGRCGMGCVCGHEVSP